jgi:putative nucleotidyltransferase with HDIG domain
VSTNPLTIIQTADIPPIPQTLQRILSLVDNPNTTSSELEKLVSQEPALATKLLKWVNSAHYALPRKVSSISHSMILLGFATVKSIASGLMLINTFDDLGLEDREFVHGVWMHSLRAANFSKILAGSEANSKQDDIFLAAMVHDIGYIVLSEYFGKRYQLLSRKNPYPAVADEDQLLGVNHAVIGMTLLKQWHFPEEVIELVRCHHCVSEYMGAKKDLVFLVLSDALAHETDLEAFFAREESTIDPEFIQMLSLIRWDWPRLRAASVKFGEAVKMTRDLFPESPGSKAQPDEN